MVFVAKHPQILVSGPANISFFRFYVSFILEKKQNEKPSPAFKLSGITCDPPAAP